MKTMKVMKTVPAKAKNNGTKKNNQKPVPVSRMATKAKTSNVFIAMPDPSDKASTAAGSAPKPERTPSSLHTVEIKFNMADVGKKKDNGAQVVWADGASLRAGTPKDDHGMATLSNRFLQQIKLPKKPDGVLEAQSGFQGPNSGANPYQGITWCRIDACYGTTQTKARHAITFQAKQLVTMMEKCFLNVDDVQVPKEADKGAWSATSTVLGQRVQMVREGTKMAGGTWKRSQRLNFILKVPKNVPKAAAKILRTFAEQHSEVVTFSCGE